LRDLPKDIITEMKIRFDSDYDYALKILIEHLTENEYLNSDRIIRCVIFLSDNGIESFKSYLKSAIGDPRDVMLWAEYEPPKNATDNSKRIWDFSKPFKENDIKNRGNNYN
jgi:hypothetical protein